MSFSLPPYPIILYISVASVLAILSFVAGAFFGIALESKELAIKKLTGNNKYYLISHNNKSVLVRKTGHNEMLIGIRKNVRTAFHKLNKSWIDRGNHPLVIVSGYRPAWYNRSVGGARKSYHIKGQALDLHVNDLDIRQRKKLIKLAQKHGFTGYGVGSTRLHIDFGRKRNYGYPIGAGVPRWARDLF